MRTVSTAEWEAFAAREPFFAVFTDEKYRKSNVTADGVRDFYASGIAHVARVLDRIENDLDRYFVPRTALEYGCGPGRLALAFARRGLQVTAVDISAAMLRSAARAAEEQKIEGVFFKTAESFLDSDETFDVVSCHLLLQRLPKSDALRLIDTLLERVSAGGVCVLQFACAQPSGLVKRAANGLRARVPAANHIANRLRRLDLDRPFIPTNTLLIEEVLLRLRAHGMLNPRVELEQHGEMESALLLAQKPHPTMQTSGPPQASSETPAQVAATDRIDVQTLIASSSIEELNRKAEQYFSSLTSWDEHHAKPFANVADTPALLINTAVALQGLELAAGMTIVDFGGGSGWLTRLLAQLGLKAILIDVSPTALEISKKLFERMPLIGECPQPEFLLYDGVRINLPDESADRIICFDAFHHSPNPSQVIGEFARILRSGGIAGFAEPGPRHSRTAQSQFEMRTYGVIENDVDIDAIWTTAKESGFTDIRVAALNVPRFQLSLDDFHDLLSGGPTLARWSEAARSYLQDARMFFLSKGERVADSRRPEGLVADVSVSLSSLEIAEGNPLEVHATVRNKGTAHWLPSDASPGGVSLGCHLYSATGELIDFDYHWQPLPAVLDAGQLQTFDFRVRSPRRGKYRLEFDCVANEVSWFSQLGSATFTITFEVV